MTETSQHPEKEADRRADNAAILVIGVMLLISFVIQALSVQTEMHRNFPSVSWKDPWLKEFSSHSVLFVLALFIPRVLLVAPMAAESWQRMLVVHVVAALVFSFLHVLLMYGLRLVLFPILVGQPYGYNLLSPASLLYELRKDSFTYALLMFAFFAFRSIEQRRLEYKSAVNSARNDGRLTLKSGGSRFVVQAHDILWAKASGNYVDVKTPSQNFLARMTLTRLEGLLSEVGDRHVRVHRSHIINLEEVSLITPTGEGSVNIEMSDGTVLTGSRRFRAVLDRIESELPNAT